MLNSEEQSLIIKMFIENKMSIKELKKLDFDISQIPMQGKIEISKLAAQNGYSLANLSDIGINVNNFSPEIQTFIQRIIASNKLKSSISKTLQER